MTMSTIATDHIEELLFLVIGFTRSRRRVLMDNLHRMDVEGFFPQDLAVKEFSEQLHAAITEHMSRHRLILRDNPHVRFDEEGRLDLLCETDHHARQLLDSDPKAYQRYQMQRLLENALNEEIALKMLRAYTGRVAHEDTPTVDPTRPYWPLRRIDLTDDRINP
jgi:hypothetical protein